MTVEGHHDGAAETVRAALDDLERLIRSYAGPGTLRRDVLTNAVPVFE